MKRAVEEILKFNEERDWDQFHNPENLAKSISIEAGELEYIKLDRDKSTFKSHRDFSSEKEITFKHL